MTEDEIRFVGFDAEFAISEVLELSVYACGRGVESDNGESVEVFHQYFKPRKEHRWPGSERVHHISPQMVAHRPYFSRFREMVQQLIDEADCLVGFAISNDVEALTREGVKRLDEKPAIDIRDLHWLCHGRDKGVELDSRRGLSVTATELGVEFSDTAAHGASYDTCKTMECLRILLPQFEERYPRDKDVTPSLLEHYLQIWETEREAYYREYAKGWIALVEARGGFRLKASRLAAPEGDKVIAVIRVDARNRATDEIDARFDRRRHPLDRNVYRLTDDDIKWFKRYTNEYDGNEQLHSRMQKLRSHGLS